MKLGCVVLASAVGASAVGAYGQQATPPAPPAPTTQPAAGTPAVVQVPPPGEDVGALAQSVRQAPDPSAAVAAYAAAVARVGGAHPAVEDAYVRRMVEFNLPDLAEAQAQDLVKQDPNHDVARAVVAYVQGRRGQAVDALATIVQATGGAVTDAFVLRTAGQLMAWYDTRADQGTIPEQLRSDVEAMRRKLSAQDAYGQAYAAARDAYQGKTAEQPLQPQPSASTYETPSVTEPAPTEVPPPVSYDDSYLYSYPSGYSGYYYQPSYYWSQDYRWPRHHLYNPGYVPPVIIPRHHHGDWDHGHSGRDWHDGHDGHDGRDGHDGHDGRGPGRGDGGHDHDGDHDHGHDGNHGSPGGTGGGGGGGGGLSPRVHPYDDMRTSRNRDGTVTAERAIEPRGGGGGGATDRAASPEPRGRGRAADAPAQQPAPQAQPRQQPRQQQQRSAADGGARAPRADVSPRSERRIDPPAAARPAPPAPRQPPSASSDRSGSQQQQQRSGGGGGGGRDRSR